ncbi:tetratricopeptide repeat protein [Rhodocaloribacter litoris]|uniref:tetratricopeptide repeat protein n=1 Tax=Rhodocaloribacter litoris TaxID=2558931 RepID=UPI00141D7F29|nr:tetratricopeptide repeat protein [Rhodocaloribacter litoris]QXD14698.1 tetratricopeptide repeat protein [Rhodocaloribacter litoris]
MRRVLLLLLLLAPVIGGALPLRAQPADPMEQGILAFRAGDYARAVAAFEQAVKNDPQNAEAYFLLARIYFETPLRDTGKAGRFIDRALEVEPENVKYLVAKLEQLRLDSWNFIVDKIREQQRRDLARKILRLDSTNAFAHEELGRAYIRDFWRYRNAFMYPTFAFRQFNGRDPLQADPLLGFQSEFAQFDPTTGGSQLEIVEASREPLGDPSDPNLVFLADEFDLEALQAQGVPVQDLSRRAQRAYDLAIGHLRKALEHDPRKRAVYDDMMRIFALKGAYPEALEMLQQMYVYFPEDPALWTYLGLAHYRSGNAVAAAKAFQTAFQYMDPEMADAYTRLDEILPEEERKKYEADRAGYASRFWTSKDPRYLTPYNERKLEHYARLTYADLLYGSPKLKLRGWNTERGRILVRYGIPKTDVIIMPSQTRGQQRGLNPIAASAPPPDADIAADPANLQTGLQQFTGNFESDFDVTVEANTFNVWDYGDFRFVFEDPFRNGEFRLYSPSADAIAAGSLPWLNDYEIRARETFRRIPERYEYAPPGRQVEIPYLVSAFKGENGQADLYVHFGIPINHYDPEAGMINLTANAGTFLVSSERDMLAERRRTIYGLRTDQIVSFSETNLWIDGQVLAAPPGEHDVSVEFETAGGGTVAVQRRRVRVPDFTAGTLQLSDVMLAYRVEEAPDGKPVLPSDVVRHGLSIQAAPWSVFSHRQPIYLYFEVYNLTQAGDGTTHYEIEAVLRPKDTSGGLGKLVKGLFGGGDKGVSVSLPGEGRTPDEHHYLILDASNQEPGRLYTLHLRVRDQVSGKSVEKEMDLFLE